MNEGEAEEQIGDVTVAEEVDQPSVGCVSDKQHDESDASLQQRAEKYNLSAINVRSIIHHVLKDDRVQSLLQGGEGSPSKEEQSGAVVEEIGDILGPTLTRAQVKKSLEEGRPVDPLSPLKMVLSRMPGTPLKRHLHSPAKPAPKIPLQRFVDMSFPDDDPLDDEYNPDKMDGDVDSSGEDDELSFFDTDVSSLAGTPAPSASEPSQPNSAAKPPATDSAQDTELAETEYIARQTRSKCSLGELSLAQIEAAFQAPDTEPLQEEVPNDLDEEEVEWRAWLGELMRDFPSPAEGADDDDGDYNFLADQQQEAEEVEEFRNDRAVRIPDEEVSDLIEELLSSYTAPPTIAESARVFPVPNALPLLSRQQMYLSHEQVITVWTQIQKFFQLLMQSFVLARFEPSLVFLSQIAAKAVEEMCSLRDSHTGRGLWEVPFLDEGVALIHSLNPYDNIAMHSLQTGQSRPPVSEVAAEVMFNNALFWAHPELLPRAGPAALSNTSLSRTSPFTPAEDNLLVLGMQRFGPSAWKETCLHLLPTKTVTQLRNHVKNLCAVKRKWNIVKQWKKTGQLVLNPPEVEGEDALPLWVQDIIEKRAKGHTPPAQVVLRHAPLERPIAPKADNLGGAASAPPLKEQGTLSPAAGAPLITTVMSALPEDQAKAIQEQLEGLGMTLKSSPKKWADRGSPEKRPLAVIPKVVKGKQGKGSSRAGGGRRRGRPSTRADRMQPVPGGQGAPGGESPKPVQERQQMMAVLTGAGLQTSDPTAQFLYCYITEVKVELSGAPKVYSEFLKALLQARELHWSPKEIYTRVVAILEDWPHLVRLFADFLSPQEAADVNALQDKACTVWAKAFVAKLQNRFSSDPQQLQRLLRALSMPELTREKVCESVMPLLSDHPDLVSDLKQCIAGAPPTSRQAGEVFEEVTWDGHTIPPPEECCVERAVLVETPTGSLVEAGVEKGQVESKASRKGGSQTQREKGTGGSKRAKGTASSETSTAKRRKPAEEGGDHDKPDKPGESSRQATKSPQMIPTVSEQDPQPCSVWSREEDRQILEVSYVEGRRMDALGRVAEQLGRPTEEVFERYTFLLEQYHKAFLQQQS